MLARRLGHQAGLDGVRAFAVVVVIGYHYWKDAVPGGWIGVQLFFVLSGFLITSLLLAERSGTGRVSIGRFYMRRALRLLPALVVMLAVYTAAMTIGAGRRAGSEAGTSSLKALSYGYNWFTVSDGGWPALGHLWSLSVEEQFYVAWPAILVGVLWLWRRSPRAHVAIIAITAAGAIASAALQAHFFTQPGGGIRGVAGTDATAYPILVGCLLAEFRSYRLVDHSRLDRWAGPAGLVFLGGFVLFADDALFLSRVAVTAAALALVWGTIDDRSPCVRWLAVEPLRQVGRISYGLYLWHIPALLIVRAVAHDISAPRWSITPVALGATIVAGVLSFRFVETPFLRLKNRFEVQTDPAPAFPTPAQA